MIRKLRGQGVGTVAVAMLAVATLTAPARAGKVAWLDDLMQQVIAEAKSGGKNVAREIGGDGASAGARRLFPRLNADESLERLVRQSDDLARAGRAVEHPAEALLESRFSRLMGQDPQAVRTFAGLPAAEKRLVVELGETAQRLARRYPDGAEGMVRQLGPEGLTAVRVYGDDVAEVLAKEGPESLSVLRKTGRSGWSFFTGTVLPHKKKLAAAGVLAAFLADPERFVDYAGKATEYAVREFGKAGIQLAAAITGGAARGIEATVGEALDAYGLNVRVLRYLGMAAAGMVVVISFLVVIGLPVRWMFRPVVGPIRWAISMRKAGRVV